MTTTVDTLDELPCLVGQQLGVSSWMEVDQSRIDAFADATNDHRWIHVDRERAQAGRAHRVPQYRHPPAMLVRLSRTVCLSGSPGGRTRSQRATVSRSSVTASPSRPTR